MIKKIHFYRFDKNNSYHEFKLPHYISIKSFADCNPDWGIVFHYNDYPISGWFELLKDELKDRLILVKYIPTSWDRYDNVNHLVDHLKLCDAYNEGGLYVDSDFICLRPLKDLLIPDKLNLIEERDPVTFKFHQLGIGLFYSDERDTTLLKWKSEVDKYEKGKGWTYWSGELPTEIWKSSPEGFKILPYSLINPISYLRESLADLFLHNHEVINAYTVHFSESISWDRFLKPLTLEHIMTVETTFTKLARPYVVHLWNKESNKPKIKII